MNRKNKLLIMIIFSLTCLQSYGMQRRKEKPEAKSWQEEADFNIYNVRTDMDDCDCHEKCGNCSLFLLNATTSFCDASLRKIVGLMFSVTKKSS